MIEKVKLTILPALPSKPTKKTTHDANKFYSSGGRK